VSLTKILPPKESPTVVSARVESAQVEAAYRRVLARRPTTDELTWAVDFLTSATTEPAADGKPGLSPLEQYVQALLSTNEFTFVD
jgi:hypothetical protein